MVEERRPFRVEQMRLERQNAEGVRPSRIHNIG